MDLWAFDDRRTFVIGLWFRVISSIAFLALVGVSHSAGLLTGLRSAPAVYAALITLLVVNGAYWGVATAVGYFGGRQFYFHWLVDVAVISVALYGLGDIAEAVAIPSFSLIIVTSAAFISKRAAMIVAALSAAAIIVWTGAAVDSDPVAGGLVRWPVEKRVAVSLGSMLFFGLIAFLAGTLADSLREIGEVVAVRNRALAASNEELERLQEELTFQARVLVHDVRSPVSAAASAIEMYMAAVEGDPPGVDGGLGQRNEGAKLMDMALENLRRVDVMIDRLREAEEARSAQIERRPVSIGSLIEDLEVEFRVAFAEQRAKLVVAGDDLRVDGDREYLAIVFRNLIGNAVRHIPRDGTGVVRISSREVGDVVETRVSDNGSGVDAGEGERFFAMFQKGSGRPRPGGMGLGLALARRVVERHGGEVCFTEAELGGATVLVRLPAAEEQGNQI